MENLVVTRVDDGQNPPLTTDDAAKMVLYSVTNVFKDMLV
jgi:hypothetical protein